MHLMINDEFRMTNDERPGAWRVEREPVQSSRFELQGSKFRTSDVSLWSIRDSSFAILFLLLCALTFPSARAQNILINEIMFHPASHNLREQYVELFNPATTNVDLSGWKFTRGFKFTFPPGTTIAPSAYLVVPGHRQTFTNKYPTVTNYVGEFVIVRTTNVVGFTYTNFANALSHSHETLVLEDTQGHVVQSVFFAEEGDWGIRQRGLPDLGYQGWRWFNDADGGGKSLELINLNLPNTLGHNWSPSTVMNGTPGAANSVFSINGPPLLTGGAHSPIVPRSSDPVAITARVVDEAANPTLRLFWRLNASLSPPAFTTAPMFDDGVHGDGTAGDGIFGAFIPAQTNLSIIEFYVEAVDITDKTNTWPRKAVNLDGVTVLNRASNSVNALYQVDNTAPTNSAPYYKVILTPAELAEFTACISSAPNSDAAFNCTMISLDGQGTQVRYLGVIRNRGHGSRAVALHNFWLGLPSDSTLNGVLALHINANKPHLQTFGAAFLLRSGVTGNRSRAVQFRINSGPGLGGPPTYTYYAANEAPNSDTADLRFPSDAGGNIYEVFRDNNPPDMIWRGSNAPAYATTYFKNSNTAENDYTDIVALHRIIGTNDLWNVASARAVLNVEQWLLHLAAMAILNNTETGLNSGYNDDYQLYRGLNDPRFQLVYHDLDTIMGGTSSDTLFGALANNGVGPAMTRLIRTAPFELQYHQTLQRLLNTSFAKPNFDALADQTLGFYVPASAINSLKTWGDGRRAYVQGQLNAYFATNPPPPTATISGEPRSPTPFATATLTVGGSNVVSYKFKLNNSAYGAETPVATAIALSGLANGSTNVVAVIGKSSAGAWQDTSSATLSKVWIVNTATPAVRLNEVLAQNVTVLNHGGLFPDAIELHNEGAASVDLGGFHLSDDATNLLKFTFPSPTIVAAGAYLVVYANANDGTGGLHTGFALDADGEGVYLADAGGALLDSVTFGVQLPDLSVGRFGTSGEWKLCQPSFGATNVVKPTGVLANVRINEWQASGVPPFTEDFVELFNPGLAPVDLGNCYLTDNAIGAPTRHRLPPLSFISSNGFLSFKADGSAAARHVSFMLSTVQGEIGLLDPTVAVIDNVIYGPQLPGVSQGRCADGVAKFVSLATPTPGAPNACPAPATGLMLNEVLANNQTRTEPDGSTPDWVEIYNGTNVTLNLADLSLSDDVANPRRWVFPSVTLAAQTHLRIFFDADKPTSATNTGFRLKAGGGAVWLFNSLASGGALLDSIAFGPQAADFSIGRVPSGGTSWQLGAPTPAATNVTVALGDPLQLKINEWLANPASGDDAFEIYNPTTQPVALADLWLTDDLTTASTRMKHKIAKLSFVGTNVFGFVKFTADNQPQNGADHVSFSLAAGGEALGLSQTNGTLIDGVTFGVQSLGVSQGRFPDGAVGVVSFPFSESLGDANWLPLTNVVINEVLTHTDPPLEDAIEILNTNAASVSLTGWFLSDDKSNLKKYPITNAITLPPGGFKVFYETQFNDVALAPNNFTLNAAHGDNVILAEATNGVLTGYRAQVSFVAAANGVSFGRHRRSDGQHDLVAMSARTFGVDSPATVAQFRTGTGLANAYPLVGPVVISEIMFQPPLLGGLDNTRDEFIELRNATATAVALYDTNYPTNTWRWRGAVEFDFPPGVILGATSTLIVVSFDPATDPTTLAAFKSAYGVSGALTVLGPWRGKLGNTAESLSLERPDGVQLAPHPDAGFVPFVTVEKISYASTAPWPTTASGTGQSLQRLSLTGYGNDPTNWLAAAPTLVVSASGDSDGDGMPDAWELAHGLNPNLNDAALDADGDGMTNLQEYLAGTDPQSAASRLFVTGSFESTNLIRLQFDAVSNVTYTFQSRVSLSTGVWLNLVSVPAAPINRSITITNPAAPMKFYRVVVP